MMERQKDFEFYRKEYRFFSYDGYTMDAYDDQLIITYGFTIDHLACFHPQWSIPLHGRTIDIHDPLLNRMVFALGMVEAISYWKITCAPLWQVKCGGLDAQAVQWFKKLAYYGLGEFFYINGITTSYDDFVTIIHQNSVMPHYPDTHDYHGVMVPLGGGKDSYVSAHILKQHHDIYGYIINDVKSALHAKDVLKLKDDHTFHVHRTLDPTMLQLNQNGYLNGHTPFSALVAFSSVLVGYIHHIPYIALSNESSANESTIKDEKINHQYSKSIEFESDFQWFNHTYLSDKIHYFSFLRPLNELQITALFTHFNDYLYDFRSCNVGSKQGVWCGHCAKCCFVAIMLAAFNDDVTITSIFNHDMLNDPTLWPLYRQLSGLDENKPFECVGTRAEVVAAITLALTRRDLNHLPYVLNQFKSMVLPIEQADALLHQHGEVHHVSACFYHELSTAMKEAHLWTND